MSTLLQIPASQIVRSPLNYRKKFDEAKLQELADSLRIHGLVQPVSVRLATSPNLPPEGGVGEGGTTEPVGGDSSAPRKRGRPSKASLEAPASSASPADSFPALGEAKYELIVGERRWRAAQFVGPDFMMLAVLKDFDDAMVREVQVIENNQREDVHSLEEADAFRDMVAIDGKTPGEIAGKIGRTERYVTDRLSLANLCEESRHALLNDWITVHVAIILARHTEEDQVQSLASHLSIVVAEWKNLPGKGYTRVVTRGKYNEESEHTKLPVKKFAKVMSRVSTLPMKDAKFDTNADHPKAGSCASCQYRTGFNATLFPEIGSEEDLCSNRDCWNMKLEEFLKSLSIKAAAGEGPPIVLPGKTSEPGTVGLSSVEKVWVSDAQKKKLLAGEKVDGIQIGYDKEGDIVTFKEKGVEIPKSDAQIKQEAQQKKESEARLAKRAYAASWRKSLVEEIVNEKLLEQNPAGLTEFFTTPGFLLALFGLLLDNNGIDSELFGLDEDYDHTEDDPNNMLLRIIQLLVSEEVEGFPSWSSNLLPEVLVLESMCSALCIEDLVDKHKATAAVTYLTKNGLDSAEVDKEALS